MNEITVVERSQDQMELAQMPVLSIQKVVERFNALGEFVKTVMKPGSDYGAIPGTEKNTLLKAGAEKLCTLFGLSKQFVITHQIEDWSGGGSGGFGTAVAGKPGDGEPLFYYIYRCRLFRNDMLIAEADGSANSRESKYRWRWVKADDVPKGINKDTLPRRSGSISEFDFAIKKAETSGPYGKKPEYWKRFQDAIAAGTARSITKRTKTNKDLPAWEIGDELYRVPNDDIASQINTIQKMAQKRALVAATLLAVNASDYFTQDVEDFEPIDMPGAPVAPVDRDQDQRSEAELFEIAWLEASRERGFSDAQALGIRTTALAKHKMTPETATSEMRLKLLDAMKHGQFDKLKENGNGNGAGDAPDASPEPQPPSDAPAAGPVDPIWDALNQEWEDATRVLIEVGEKAGYKRSEVAMGIARHTSLILALNGKEQNITMAQKRALYDAIAGRTFDEKTGQLVKAA